MQHRVPHHQVERVIVEGQRLGIDDLAVDVQLQATGVCTATSTIPGEMSLAVPAP